MNAKLERVYEQLVVASTAYARLQVAALTWVDSVSGDVRPRFTLEVLSDIDDARRELDILKNKVEDAIK